VRFSKHLAVAAAVALGGGIAAPGIAVAGAGPSWAIQSTPSPGGRQGSILLGMSCPSARACTAVGAISPLSRPKGTITEYWNGRKWAVQHAPNPSDAGASPLLGVSCSSATACTAVGPYVKKKSGAELTLAERYS
jgi:hypothetical protein